MRKQLVAFLAALTVIAGLGVLGAPSASAHPKVCVFQGIATTGSLGLPVPPRTVPWSITSKIAVCVNSGPLRVDPITTATITGSGSLTGGCGQSTGNGSVDLNIDLHSVGWVSNASLLIINPVVPSSGNTLGVVNAVADPTVPNNSCANGTATKFLVQGIIAGI